MHLSIVIGFLHLTCLNVVYSTPFAIKNIAETSDNERHSKNLFPFVWVTFSPEPCGNNLDGVCIQRGRCSRRNGTVEGTCQNSFGECCKFTDKCSKNMTTVDVDQFVTTLQSGDPKTSQCTYKFKKEPNICQIRLDFQEFESEKANEQGDCDMDQLKISGSVTVANNFVACGKLTEQHMFLTFGSSESIDVSPLLKSAQGRYKIKATRIACDSKNKAPDYCLQYFTEDYKTNIKSFGYDEQQQNNQQYTICVKPTFTSTAIKWKQCSSSSSDTFDIQTNSGSENEPCKHDWVQVKGYDRQCGNQFSSPPSTFKPYELTVNFDNEEGPDLQSLTGYTFPVLPENPSAKDCNETCRGGNELVIISCNPDNYCLITPTDAFLPVLNALPPPDVVNKGFCLEYTQ